MELVDLPADVLRLIISQLQTTQPLFVPDYCDEHDHGETARKCAEFYGLPTSDQIESSESLVNWSVTSRVFRHLIAPKLFETVILRTKPKSMASMKALAKSPHWSLIRNFIVAIHFDSELDNLGETEEDWEGETDEEIEANMRTVGARRIQPERDEFYEVMTNLPPNLTSLALDFPCGWTQYEERDHMHYEHYYFDPEEEKEPYEAFQRPLALLKAMIMGAHQYDISQKPNFELRLLNMPPYCCSFYGDAQYAEFLNQVSSFTLAPCHFSNDLGHQMNTTTSAVRWANNLYKWYFANMDNVRTFRLHADEACPLGLAPLRNHMPLGLPSKSRSMPKLEHVSFRYIFLCPQLINFLTAHAETLTSIELLDCLADGNPDHTELERGPTWKAFFEELVKVKWTRLRELKVDFPGIPMDDRLGIAHAYGINGEDLGKVHQVSDQLDRNEQDEIANGAKEADVRRRSRKVLPYCMLDEEMGSICHLESLNSVRFLKGEDHEAYLQLVSIVEENVRNEEVFRST